MITSSYLGGPESRYRLREAIRKMKRDGTWGRSPKQSASPSPEPSGYPDFDPKRGADPSRFNCGGTACRNYEYMSLDETKEAMANLRETPCDESCKPGDDTRCVLWEYDICIKDPKGNVVRQHHDFHVVCGPVNPKDGTGPEEVDTKNGPGPVSKVPLDKARLPDSEPLGSGYTKNRVNVTETCYCGKFSDMKGGP